MRTLVLLLLVSAFASASASGSKPKSQFTRYRSWNTQRYPMWKNGDQRFKSSWTGGEVTFDVKNDSPTLTGARATFTIDLNFPQNQTLLPNGTVVWARNCTIDGRNYQKGQLVYPNHDNNWTGVFPNGTPFQKGKDKKNLYVYVWKAWGRYWQVADGPSSSLSLNTRDTPLGSYNMEVVIYHCRNKDKFIPLGYASTVFTITDQVPFTMSLSQVNDVNQADKSFIQKRAIAFSVKVHDPSQYLDSADISFSWDFGDSSGTLISRELTVTHTYLDVGAFKPQVVLMASIPNNCGSPTVVAPIDASAATAEVVVEPTLAGIPAAPIDGGDAMVPDLPASDATPLAASLQPAVAVTDAVAVVVIASVAPQVNAAVLPDDPANTVAPAAGADVAAVVTDATGEVVSAAQEPADAVTAAPVAVVTNAAPVAEEEEAAVEVAATVSPVDPVAEGEVASVEVAATVAATVAPVAPAVATEQDANVVATAAPEADVVVDNVAAEVVQDETEAPVDDIVVTVVPEAAAADAEAAENEVAATAAPAALPTAQVPLVVAKRDVSDLADCNVYRYGSVATSLDVIPAIESVEIVQMSGVLSLATELEQNAVDVTVVCQGSLPREVCTVISDADCVTPMETVCTEARPSPDCQMILRSFFNDTGVFCINVSLTNDVSFAVASARVSVSLASTGSQAGTAVTVLGVMVLACVVCCIGLMYRRFKQYQPLNEDGAHSNGGSSGVTSVPMLLWNLLSRQTPGESRPLLHGRIV
uniref:premelanosome protein a n=1 Tax=Semicossyphus pulcher TaxID=241346 RepID=UPI0037E79201